MERRRIGGLPDAPVVRPQLGRIEDTSPPEQQDQLHHIREIVSAVFDILHLVVAQSFLLALAVYGAYSYFTRQP
jgi:hypothetical protein